MKIDFIRDSVVQAALIFHQVVNHPGCRAAACDKDDVIAEVGPGVPEVFQCLDEVALLAVNPWHFIDKDYLAFFCV